MLIAQIAYDRLNPEAKQQVDRLSAALNSDPLTEELPDKDMPEQPVTIATWPDDIRGLGQQTRQFSPWHFIDMDSLPVGTFSHAKSSVPAMPIADAEEIADVKAYTNDRSDVYLQIIAQSAILKDKTQPISARSRALAFVEHFVGDIHQPLHCIGRQLGGNRYIIDELPGADPDWKITNLHSFWDNAYRYQITDGQITVNSLLQTPRPTTPDTGEIKSWADTIVKNDLPSDPVVLKQTDPAAWAAESNVLATTFAFPADNTMNLSNDYIQHASDIARERIALAGFRLANLLNSLIGHS
jgi:hypothetical protein